MKNSSPSREELFALVWEHPATEVARELGISDVALGKLCSKLQVPKPPRGYWAKIAAGRKPRHPPLKVYREGLEKQFKKQITFNTPITELSPFFESQVIKSLKRKDFFSNRTKSGLSIEYHTVTYNQLYSKENPDV